MITFKKIRVYSETFSNCLFSIEDIKEALIRLYYPKISEERLKDEMKRELVITPVWGRYGYLSSIVYTINGSPPKGEGILLINDCCKEFWEGDFIAISRCVKIEVIKNLRIKSHIISNSEQNSLQEKQE